MHVSATSLAGQAATIVSEGNAATHSSLAGRVLSATGSVIGFLGQTTELLGAFGLGVTVGVKVFDPNGPKDAINIAGYSLVGFTVLNVAKCVLFGPTTFLYSSLVDGVLGATGFGVGVMVTGLQKLNSR